MNPEDAKWCDQLAEACELQTDEDFEKYTEAISCLSESDDPEVLQKMLRCFRDVDAGEIQYELVEACETYPDSVYVDVFIEESLYFAEKSPQWYKLMFQSILNTENCKNLSIFKINSLENTKKEFFIKYIEKLSLHTPKYSNITQMIQ